jgi:N-carbamoylputrescine amidase
MTRTVRAALTETRNAFAAMPARVEELATLAGKLDDVRAANLARHVELLEAARAEGAEVVCLGELFPAPYFALTREPVWLGLAEDAESGPSVSAMRAAAKRLGLAIVAPIYELDRASGKRFNTAIVISHEGEVLGSYRKTHIPCGENERARFSETFYYERSDGGMRQTRANVSKNRFFPVFATRAGRIGIATCYDRHFEGAVSTLAREGAEIVFSPAVTFGAKSERMWPLEFAVDACRHRVFIGGSNRRGAEPPWNVEFFGRSHFVGPDGPIANVSRHPELVIADLDLDALAADDPSGWNLARDARPDVYSPRGGK